jgi:hypothetical protein
VIAAADTRSFTDTRSGHRPGSLVVPVLRHTVVLVGAALAVYLASAQLGEGDPVAWLLAGAAVGAAAAVLAMGWLGLPFLLIGAVFGVLLEYHLRLGPTPQAAHELADNLGTYLAALATASVAYLAVTLILPMVRRRR